MGLEKGCYLVCEPIILFYFSFKKNLKFFEWGGALNFTIFLGVQMLQVNLGLGTTGKSVQVVMNSVGLELVIGHAILCESRCPLFTIHAEREGDLQIFIQAVKGFGIIGPMRAQGGGPFANVVQLFEFLKNHGFEFFNYHNSKN